MMQKSEKKVQLSIRLKPSLKARLEQVAEQEHRSLSAQIELFLEKQLSKEQGGIYHVSP
jgi:hypothetical protein